MMQPNLLPWRQRLRQSQRMTLSLILTFILAFFLLLTIYWHHTNSIELNHIEKENNTLEVAIAGLDTKLNTLSQVSTEATAITKKLTALQGIVAGRNNITSMLEALMTVMPRNCKLTRLKQLPLMTSLTGHCQKHVTLQTLIDTLKTDYPKRSVNLTEANQAKTGIFYKITLTLPAPKKLERNDGE